MSENEIPETNGTKDDNSLSLIYSTIKETLKFQQEQKTSLETKANALSAFAGGIFALLMGARESILQFGTVSRYLILFSLILFFLSVVLNTIVSWVRRFRYDPDPEMLAQNYLNKTELETKLQLVSNLNGSWKRNKAVLEKNGKYLTISFLAQAMAFSLLGIALFITVV